MAGSGGWIPKKDDGYKTASDWKLGTKKGATRREKLRKVGLRKKKISRGRHLGGKNGDSHTGAKENG